jgi:hypothetical protein
MTAPVEVPTLEEAVHRARATNRTRSESWLLRLVGPGSWAIWANLICVLGVIVVTLSQLHPSLLFAQTTTAGGDTGAHVALPAFLKNDLLPEGRLTGWDPGWYDGFPLYTFYFPLPGMVVVLFNVVFSYDVAFKLVTVLGSVLLPICAWAFGRLSGLRDPLPACLAAATLPFLFEPSFTIYGGNLLSTLAGEFSFSLSLSIGLLFLGVVCRGLRTGRYRVLAGVLFAITLLCHLIPALFVGAGAVVWLVLDADVIRSLRTGAGGKRARRRVRGRVWWAVVTGFIGLGLTAWWLVPFGAYQAYTTNMGYTNVFGFPNLLFPEEARWVLVADAVGLVAMVLRRNRVALFIVVMGGLSAAAVCLDPQGKLYNVRFLVPLHLPDGRVRSGRGRGRCRSLVPPPPPVGMGRGGPLQLGPRWGLLARCVASPGDLGHRGDRQRERDRSGRRERRLASRRPCDPPSPSASARAGRRGGRAARGPLRRLFGRRAALRGLCVDLGQHWRQRRAQPAERLGRLELRGLRGEARLPRVPRRHPDDVQRGCR